MEGKEDLRNSIVAFIQDASSFTADTINPVRDKINSLAITIKEATITVQKFTEPFNDFLQSIELSSGTCYKPKIGDIVKLFKTFGHQTPISIIYARAYNDKNIQPTLANEGDFAIGNFLKKCYLKFVGKNLETSEDIENIKIQPKNRIIFKNWKQ